MNVARTLDQALDSIEAQTLRDLQIICVNDGSTDETLDILQAHAARDERIEVIDQPNAGYGTSCNRGIEAAHGEWLAIVEPDDWIEPTMYERMVAYAERTGARDRSAYIDVVKTPYWRITHPDTPRERRLNCSYRHRVKPAHQPFTIGDAAHLLTHHPSIWSALYRRRFIEDFHIRFMPIPGAGWSDNPFLLDTLVRARGIIYLDEPFYNYREDTPEKFAAFTLRNPLLPLERWQDMANVLDRLHVSDPRIWAAQNSRGFTYLAGVMEQIGLDDPELHAAAVALFERMDPALVLADAGISPGSKELFCRLRGLPEPHVSRLPYLRRLVAQGFYNLYNTGLGNTWYMVMDYVKTHGKHIDK
jgi:glycosyltransferase involved in cell wall biosynthesis